MKKKESQIINNEKVWLCPVCKRWLASSSYYHSQRTSNKLTSEWRNCHIRTAIRTRDSENNRRLKRESARRLRALNPGKYRTIDRNRKRRPLDNRFYARQMVHNAIKLGILVKPIYCEICGQEKRLTAHHDDYLKPLEVKWWCYECHGNK